MKFTSTVALCAIATALAQKCQKEDRRRVKLDGEGQEVKFEGEASEACAKNKINIRFDTSDKSARMRLDYRAKSKEAKAGLSMRAKLSELVEFTDANGDNVPQQDEVESRLTFDNWDNIPTKKIEIEGSATGDQNLDFETKTTDGHVSIHGYFTNAPLTKVVNETSGLSVELTPNAFKFDFGVHNFPYTKTGTKLALRAKFRTKSKTKEAGSNTVVTVDDGVNAEFVWDSTIDCDGTAVNVAKSPLEVTTDDDGNDKLDGENDKALWLTFDTTTQCENLFWDPRIETFGDASSASASVPALGALMIAALGALRL